MIDPALTRVRAMVAEDVPAVTAIEADSFPTPWSEATFHEVLAHSGSALARVVEGPPETGAGKNPDARVEGRVVGYAILRTVGQEGELLNIAIRADRRGCGLGTLLLDDVLSEARARGVEHLFLEVRRSNEAALRMYQGRGFRFVGIRRGYYSRPVEDAKIMLLNLREPARSPSLPSDA